MTKKKFKIDSLKKMIQKNHYLDRYMIYYYF